MTDNEKEKLKAIVTRAYKASGFSGVDEILIDPAAAAGFCADVVRDYFPLSPTYPDIMRALLTVRKAGELS
jgi:hypothetical protein